MIRRLLRWAVNGLCLLSLLAGLATAWLWWRARPHDPDRLDIAAGGLLVRGSSHGWGVDLDAYGDTGSPPDVWARSADAPVGPDVRMFRIWPDPTRRREWRWAWWQGATGPAEAFVGPDGRVTRLTHEETADLHFRLGRAGMRPVRQWSIYAVPHWQILLATAAGPATWAAGWGRRAWRGRRRARAGHCPACGYDLRATPDAAGPRLPRCPECGAVPAEGAA